MRLPISPTPSNTPSNTPSFTPTGTECPIGCFDVLQQICCEVKSLSIDPVNGDLYVAGDLDNYGGFPVDTIFRLKKTGEFDFSFNYTGVTFTAQKILSLSDGKIFMAGRDNIPMVKILNNGLTDSTFTELSMSRPLSTAVSYGFDLQSDGKIVVGGTFTSVSGNSYNRLCRLNPNGTLDTTFNIGTGFSNQVLSVVVQPDDKILVAGSFSQFSGISVQGLVRLNPNGSLDTTFNPPAGAGGYSTLLLSDGKIINQVNNTIRRLNSDGNIDSSFAAVTIGGGYNQVNSYDIEPSTGKVFAAGYFDTINGSPRKGLVKINTDGTIDTSLNIGTGFGSVFFYSAYVVKRKYNGDLYVGGIYDSYNGDTNIKIFTELTPTGEVFECQVGTCYDYQINKLPSALSGTTTIIDCNGLLRVLLNNDTQPIKFCATKILSTTNAIISGGTDIATNCCYEFENIGTSSTSVQFEDCTNVQRNQIAVVGARFCAKYLEYNPLAGPTNQPIRQIGSCNLPTPTPTVTATRTPTPTRTPSSTPTQTQTPSQTGTIGLTPTTTRTPTLTPTNTQTATQTRTPNITPSMTATNTPTGTPPVVCNTNWTIRNADCGLGTVNDIGINGSFMGTLSGPSTFPLTSTLYGTKANPNGVICGGSNTIQANVTTNIAGTGNCAFMEIIINGVSQHILYFTTNPFPQISGVVINNGDSVEVRIGCFLGPCPSQPAVTSTPTMTPTVTPTQSVLCIDINTNNSLDIVINQVIVNGLIAYTTGGVMPNVPGNGTNLAVVLPAGTYTVDIAYTCSITGQRIEMTSPLTGYYCQNTSTGSNLMTFTGVGFSTLNCLQIFPQDGTC